MSRTSSARRGAQTAPTSRSAFEALVSSSRLPEHLRAETLAMFDHGRGDQIETWAERLDGDPTGGFDHIGTGHARCLSADVREAVAESRSLRAAAVGRSTDQRRQAA